MKDLSWHLENFYVAIVVFACCYLFVLLAIASDLWSGVRKARKAGKLRTSKGYRATVDKMGKYYNSLFAGGIIDLFILMALSILQSKGFILKFPLVPPVTILAGAYIAFIEFKSVLEKLEDKEKAKLSSDFQELQTWLRVLKDDKQKQALLDFMLSINSKPSKTDSNEKTNPSD